MSYVLTASPLSLMRGMEQFILSGTLKSVKSVKWEVDASTHTTGSCIVLPVPVIGMSDVDLALWRYKCQHEIGHESVCNSKPHWKEVMVKEKPKHNSKILWKIINILSDHVQEKNCLGEYYGRDGILLHGREMFMKHMVMPELSKDPTPKMAQLFLYDTNDRTEWNPYLTKYPHYHDEEFFKKVALCGQWRDLHNENDTLALGLEIVKLFEDEQEQEQEASGKGSGGKGSGEDASDKFIPSMHKEIQDSVDPNPQVFNDDGSRRHAYPASRVAVRTPYSLRKLKADYGH